MIGGAHPTAVRARLERAEHHVQDLKRVIAEYKNGPPYRVTHRLGSRPGRIIERAELVQEPPQEAAMIVSDAVHQTRAALDNFVNAIRKGGPTSGIYFPISSTESAFDEAAKKALDGVPDWARQTIRALQPFSTDLRRWAGDELPNLHDLARIDRHRLPPIHAAVLQPDYAVSDGVDDVVASADPHRRWAEWEYTPGKVSAVAFKVQVRFGPDSGQPDGVEVGGWTDYLVRRTTEALHMILRSVPRT